MSMRLATAASLLAVTAANAELPSQRFALKAPEARLTVHADGVDRAAAFAEDAQKPKAARLRYALRRDVADIRTQNAGEWIDLPNAMALWRLPIRADNAISLDFGFRDFFLPPGAQLFIGNESEQLAPFDDSNNPRNGKFWTPLVAGDHAQIEVVLPRAMKPYLRLNLAAVNVGYRDVLHRKSFFDPAEGSGSCNIDTVCPQGDAWRSPINAEALVVVSGGFCSGQLLNDSANDHAPLFSTANHCIASQDDADSLVLYWKYESPTCRAVNSDANAAPVPTTSAIAQAGGSTLLATYQPSDFTLVRLNSSPPAAAHAYWNGWDRTQTTFSGGAVMHHANSDAKRISFPAGAVTLDDTDYGQDLVPGIHHWRVDHYASGTTEEGSSGSGLLDGLQHLRGVLSGGSALCSEPDGDDYYGRLSDAWEGGQTSSSRMRDWLDPHGAQPQAVDGIGACVVPNVSLSSSAAIVKAGDHVTFTATVSGGSAPYAYSFNLGTNDAVDTLDPSSPMVTTAYPTDGTPQVSVTVTDSTGCSATAQRGQIVQSQYVRYNPGAYFSLYGGPAPTTLACGTDANQIQPGQRYTSTIYLRNDGSIAPQNGYAVFAQDLSDPNAAAVTLETPAVAIAANGESVPIAFTVSADASCGSHIGIDYLGTADDNGFSPAKARVIDATVSANCHPQACVAQTNAFAFHQGNFYDPKRSGTGITAEVAPLAGNDPLFFGAWFTGDSNRDPLWYSFSNRIHANQANGTLYRAQLVANAFPPTYVPIGTAQATYVAADKLVYTWTTGSDAGGAVMVPVVSDPAGELRAWYNPQENGWGTFDELFPSVGANGLPFMFSLAYVYDTTGTPRWVAASDGSYRDGNTLIGYVTHPGCPTCAWLDGTIGLQRAGTQRYQINGSSGTITTNFTLPAPYTGVWNRNNLPIDSLIVH